MADADDMVYVTQSKLEEFVREYTCCICKPKERMVCEDCPQAHSPRMQYCLLAQVTQTGVSVYNLNLLAYDDVSEYGKKGKDGRECRLAVDDEKGYMVDLETVCQVSYTGSTLIGVRDDDHFVAAVDEFRGELVDMRFHSAYAMLRDGPARYVRGSYRVGERRSR
jgi:hypothetical protein